MANYWNDKDDFRPCFWLGQFPVFATTLLVAAQVFAVIFIALLMAGGQVEIFTYLGFSASDLLTGRIWQIFTYPWLNISAFNSPSDLFLFALGMFFLYQFGKEVEKFLGRTRFLLFYGLLTLVCPVVLMVWNFFAIPHMYFGSSAINFGVFLAFVVLYPDMPVFFSLTARWLAIILMAIYGLQCIAKPNGQDLTVFLAVCACATVMMRRFCGKKGIFSNLLARFNNGMRSRHSSRHLKSVQKPFYAGEPEKEQMEEEEEDLHASIDPLLDKIARHGISSLTRKEKERLERVRESLLHKERKN